MKKRSSRSKPVRVSDKHPNLVVLAGPNGAGKSTSAPTLLRDELGVTEFVNADTIAQGLSAFAADEAAFAAGEVMLARLHELADRRISFAFETTLASRSFAPWIKRLIADGYRFHLVFLWLPNPQMAVKRVAERVKLGGHHVPQDTIMRRYNRGLRNFFSLYQPLAETWRVYDNSKVADPRMVAELTYGSRIRVYDKKTWMTIEAKYGKKD